MFDSRINFLIKMEIASDYVMSFIKKLLTYVPTDVAIAPVTSTFISLILNNQLKIDRTNTIIFDSTIFSTRFIKRI